MHRRPPFGYLRAVVGLSEEDVPTEAPSWFKIGFDMGPDGPPHEQNVIGVAALIIGSIVGRFAAPLFPTVMGVSAA